MPYASVAHDFNGDGKLDLAVTNAGSGAISIMLGKGDGTLIEPAIYQTGRSQTVAAGDFNGDGKLDLVANDQFNQALRSC